MWQTGIGNFGSFSALLSPLKPPRIRILKKWKKLLEISFILHICTKNHNDMRYVSWDLEWDWQNFLSFRGHFLSFNPLKTWKIKILKASGDAIILHMCIHDPMMYASWYMECDRHIFCHFGSFFALLPHNWPLKLKFGKKCKKSPEILSFYTFVPQM